MSTMENIKIVFQNVLAWTQVRRNELTNLYMTEDPDIIMLNSTGRKETERIKIFNYNTYQRNLQNENSAGIAIAIKKGLKHKIIDEYNFDLLTVEIETSRGKLHISTMYIPPRRDYLPIHDVLRILRKPHPSYIIADLNARDPILGHNGSNSTGRAIARLISGGMCLHLGPEFKTYITEVRQGTPDIILGNRNANLNMQITQGQITTSDHIPIIIHLATKPIIIRGKKSLRIKKANWSQFKDIIEQEMQTVNRSNDEANNKSYIDEELKKWYKGIQKGISQAIPLKETKILPHPRQSEKQKRLQFRYNAIKRMVSRYGWTIPLLRVFKVIQNELNEECTK